MPSSVTHKTIRQILSQTDDPYVTGVIGRIVSAGPDHITYPILFPEHDVELRFRFETPSKPRGGKAHKTFIEETPGPPTVVPSSDAAVFPMTSALGDHALTADTSGRWGLLPVSHAAFYVRSKPRRLFLSAVRGEPSSR